MQCAAALCVIYSLKRIRSMRDSFLTERPRSAVNNSCTKVSTAITIMTAPNGKWYTATLRKPSFLAHKNAAYPRILPTPTDRKRVLIV